MKRTKLSKVFKRAARLSHDSNGLAICHAVDMVSLDLKFGFVDLERANEIVQSFSPDICTTPYWGAQWGDDDDDHQIRDCRVLALLFMRAIAKSEGI